MVDEQHQTCEDPYSHPSNALYPGKLWSRVRSKAGEGKILAAVSGGGDSMALLHLCLPPAPERSRIVVGYVNHGTGAHADEAEELVRQSSQQIGVICRTATIQLARETTKEMGFEAAARIQRYQQLQNIADDHDCSLILTGHTLDDQAETLLLFLIRGKGLQGLTGIYQKKERFFRPLLAYTHEELLLFLKSNSIAFLEDPSNLDQRFARNRIRHQFAPLIKQSFGESAWRKIASRAALFQDVQNWLSDAAKEAEKDVIVKRKSLWVVLDIPELKKYFILLRKEILRNAFLKLTSEMEEPVFPSDSIISGLISFLNASPGSRKQIPGGIVAIQGGLRLILDGISCVSPIIVPAPGIIETADGTVVEVRREEISDPLTARGLPGRMEFVDAEKLAFPLTLRPWRSGDRMEPLGEAGHQRKVTRILSGSRWSASPIWVIESKGKIVWIVGERIADFCKVTSNTKEVIRFSLSE